MKLREQISTHLLLHFFQTSNFLEVPIRANSISRLDYVLYSLYSCQYFDKNYTRGALYIVETKYLNTLPLNIVLTHFNI